jgi:hypothetical protein
MSLPYRFNRLSALLMSVICVAAVAPAQDQAAPTPKIVTAKIKVDDLSMIIVPVSINGTGPYDFLLDTGCASSIMDQKLAEQLTLPQVGIRKIIGVLGATPVSVVRADSFSLAGAEVSDLKISVTANRMAVSKVRGVLGQDFLQHFDVLINYRHLTLELAPTSGSLAESLIGEHLPLRVDPANPALSAPNRLIIAGHVPELGKNEMTLLLDSGANQFTLFHQNLGPLANRSEEANTGNFGAWDNLDVASRKVRSIDLGANSVPDVTVVTIAHPVNSDTDGLVPTSFFNSIFISSHSGFVILNPSFPKSR